MLDFTIPNTLSTQRNRMNTRDLGLWGKTQGSARVRSTSGEPRVVHHNPQVPSSSFSLVAWPAPFRQSQAERKVGSRTQEVQERNSEGLGMGRHADSSLLSEIKWTHSFFYILMQSTTCCASGFYSSMYKHV